MDFDALSLRRCCHNQQDQAWWVVKAKFQVSEVLQRLRLGSTTSGNEALRLSVSSTACSSPVYRHRVYIHPSLHLPLPLCDLFIESSSVTTFSYNGPLSWNLGSCRWHKFPNHTSLLTITQPRDEIYGAYDASYLQTTGPKAHTSSPAVTGTSVVAVKFNGGVAIAADNLGMILLVSVLHPFSLIIFSLVGSLLWIPCSLHGHEASESFRRPSNSRTWRRRI